MDIPKQLQKQVIRLIDDLMDLVPEESDFLQIRLFFDIIDNPLDIMNGFIQYVLPWKEKIMNKDDSFLNEPKIFGPLPQDSVNKIKMYYTNGKFDDDDRNIIWQYFQVFIKLIEKYQKVK